MIKKREKNESASTPGKPQTERKRTQKKTAAKKPRAQKSSGVWVPPNDPDVALDKMALAIKLMEKAHAVKEYYENKDYEKACRACKGLYTGLRRVYDGDTPLTLRFESQYGMLLCMCGRFEEGLGSLHKTLKKQRLLVGEENIDTLGTEVNLAGALLKTGQFDEAEEYARHCVKVLSHSDIIAEDDSAAGLLEEAQNICTILPRVRQNVNDAVALDESPDCATEEAEALCAEAQAISALMEDGQQEKALWRTQGLLDRAKRTLGEEHPITLMTESSLAETLALFGKDAEALALSRHVLECRTKTLGENHKDTLEALLAVACSLLALERNEEALDCFRALVARSRKTFGQNDSFTLDSEFLLVRALEANGLDEDELSVAVKLFPRLQKVFGRDDEVVQELAGIIAELKEKYSGETLPLFPEEKPKAKRPKKETKK